MNRISTGIDIIQIFENAFAFRRKKPEFEREDQLNLAVAALDEVEHWGLRWDEMDAHDKFVAMKSLDMRLMQLEENGLRLLAVMDKHNVRVGGVRREFQVVVFEVAEEEWQ